MRKPSKSELALILGALAPLIVSICGWIDAHSEAVKNEKHYIVSYEAFQDYLSEERECPRCPPEAPCPQ